MPDNKTILFLTTQLPYPPVSGGVIKSWKLVEHLASQHRLRVIAMLKGQDAEHEAAFQEAVALDRYHGAALEVPRSGLNWLKSLLLSDCLNAFRNRLPALRQRVAAWAQDADLIFVDHYEMFQYVPKHFNGKVVFHEHNAEYVMWQRFSALETRPLHKAILAIEARRIRKAEARYANRADLTLAAPNDIEALAPHCHPGTRFEVTYHLGDDVLLERPPVAFAQTTESLLLVGTLTWEANVDGLLWFLKEVWPLVHQQHPQLVLDVIGKNPDDRIVQLVQSDPQVRLHGFVEDLNDWYDTARVFIAPLRFGSGIKVKVLNAMYRGIPTVTTAIGTEGLEARNGEHLFLSSDPATYANYISTLLTDADRWTALRDNSRKLAAAHYTWSRLFSAMDQHLSALFLPNG